MSEQNGDYALEHSPQKALDPGTIERIVDNQTREIELRAREIDLRQQEDRHSFEYAQAALSAQVQDRTHQRSFQLQQRKYSYQLAAFVATLIVASVIASVWLGENQVAMEIVKSVVLLLGGGGAGYAVGRHQQSQPKASDSADEA